MTIARNCVTKSRTFGILDGVIQDTSAPTRPLISLPQAAGRLRVALNEAYAQVSRESGLSAPQAELVCTAMRQPGPIGDLAGELHCDRSNVSRLVDRAANRGLIQRRDQESDGRVTVIELTPDGQRVAHHLLTTFASKLEPLLSTWSAERQEAAVQTLTELAEALEDVTRPTAAPVPPGR